MAYQNPALSFLHVLRAAGAASVTTTSEASGYGKARLLDDRKVALFKFASGAVDLTIDVDQGAAPSGNDQPNRLIIPSGHNLTGTVEVRSDAAASWPGTLEHSFTASAGLIDESFTAITARHIRLKMLSSAQWELGELVYTRKRSFTRGISPAYSDRPQPNYFQTGTVGGEEFRASLGPERRTIRVEFPYLDLAVDQAIVDDLQTVTQAGLKALWYDGADSGDTVVHVKVAGSIDVSQASRNPTGTGLVDRVRLNFIEALE